MASKSLVNIVLLNKASKGLTAMKSAGILAAQNGISGLGFELLNGIGMVFCFLCRNLCRPAIDYLCNYPIHIKN